LFDRGEKPMNYQALFTTTVTTILLGLAGYYQDTAFAYASVLSLAIGAVQSIYTRLVAIREKKPGLDDKTRQVIHDLGARVATIEYNVKQRGF